jgi:hypothetical protein
MGSKEILRRIRTVERDHDEGDEVDTGQDDAVELRIFVRLRSRLIQCDWQTLAYAFGLRTSL